MKGKELALIFDVGTQATRALVFDTAGEGVNAAAHEQATEIEPEEKAAAQTESDE